MDRYFELNLAVDPKAVEKSSPSPQPPPSGDGNEDGDGKKKKEEEAIPGYHIFIIIGAVCIVSVMLIKRRKKYLK